MIQKLETKMRISSNQEIFTYMHDLLVKARIDPYYGPFDLARRSSWGWNCINRGLDGCEVTTSVSVHTKNRGSVGVHGRELRVEIVANRRNFALVGVFFARPFVVVMVPFNRA